MIVGYAICFIEEILTRVFLTFVFNVFIVYNKKIADFEAPAVLPKPKEYFTAFRCFKCRISKVRVLPILKGGESSSQFRWFTVAKLNYNF